MTDDLTPYEKEIMDKLPKERVPSGRLEGRVVDTLRARGILHRRTRGQFVSTRSRIAGVLAASIALIAGGFAIGRMSAPSAGPGDRGSSVAEEASLALALQQAGTAYIQAIERFAAKSATSTPLEMQQGREVALTTLYAAADEVTRVIPREYLAGQFLVALDVAENTRRLSGERDGRPRSVRF